MLARRKYCSDEPVCRGGYPAGLLGGKDAVSWARRPRAVTMRRATRSREGRQQGNVRELAWRSLAAKATNRRRRVRLHVTSVETSRGILYVGYLVGQWLGSESNDSSAGNCTHLRACSRGRESARHCQVPQQSRWLPAGMRGETARLRGRRSAPGPRGSPYAGPAPSSTSRTCTSGGPPCCQNF